MGKYDIRITELASHGKGARLIASELNLNVGYVGRRLKKLGLQRKVGTNQTVDLPGKLSINFSLNSSKLNKEAELFLELLCVRNGYECSIPNYPNTYDYLVDFGEGWKKIQVKSSSSFTFSLAKSRHNATASQIILYSGTEIDYFFLYNVTGRCWLIPFNLVEGKRSLKVKRRCSGYEINPFS
jgi:hypothetical protein